MEDKPELLSYIKAQVADACARMRVTCECEDKDRHTIFRFYNEPLTLRSFFVLHWTTVESVKSVDELINCIIDYAGQCTKSF